VLTNDYEDDDYYSECTKLKGAGMFNLFCLFCPNLSSDFHVILIFITRRRQHLDVCNFNIFLSYSISL